MTAALHAPEPRPRAGVLFASIFHDAQRYTCIAENLCYNCSVMDLTEKKYSASAIVAAAGCKAVTLRAWRNRNGLFRAGIYEHTAADEQTGWNWVSFLDICIARLVVVMTNHGIDTQDAVTVAQMNGQISCWGEFLSIASGKSDRPIFAFAAAHEPDASGDAILTIAHDDMAVRDVLRATKGVAMMVDLRTIVDHVRQRLEEFTGK